MFLFGEAEFLTSVVIVRICLWQYYPVDASVTGQFSYVYLDSDKTILKLRCDGDCSTDITVLAIVIYNATSLTEIAAVTSGKAPNVFRPSIQGLSYFAAGGLSEGDSCHLELVMTKCNLLSRLQFGCNVSHSDIRASITTRSTSLTVERTASQGSSHNISTTTLIILIVVIIVVFLLAVFFLSMWLRDCCRHKDRMIYQTSPHRDINSSQVYTGDTTSVFSFQRSPCQKNDRKQSEFKLPPTQGSVRRLNSTASKGRYPPLPSVPPPKLCRQDTHNSRVPGNTIIVPLAYARPQDAIATDFSEDGDVTSSNGGTQQTYFRSKQPTEHQQCPTFYSSVSVRSVDV